MGGSALAVSQSGPGWRAAAPPAAFCISFSCRQAARQPPTPPRFQGAARPSLFQCFFLVFLFSLKPGPLRGPRNHPSFWTLRPESPDGTCSKTGALLRGLPALLPEPSASGPRLRGIHGQSGSAGAATQRRSQKRWRLADQRARTLVSGAPVSRRKALGRRRAARAE